jgi:hypothetical protein
VWPGTIPVNAKIFQRGHGRIGAALTQASLIYSGER